MRKQTSLASKGVNLGGWLVIEKWITPSLFSGTQARNEFELAKTKKGRDRISNHHASFITEPDLDWLKKQGVEILRVPIGYWIFGDDERYVSAIKQLDWLVTTSLTYGLKLLLDLHAAPSAQNSAAHSGSGNTNRTIYSTKWLNDMSAQDETIKVLERIALRYRDSPSVWGIELLNEPTIDRFGLKLARFHRTAYKRLIKVARPGTYIVFSDGYAPLLTTNTFWLRAKKNFPVIMDCHVYQVFGKKNKESSFNHNVKRTTVTKYFIQLLRLQQPIVVGEWSAMLPRKVTQAETKEFARRQLQAFAPAQAQFYWNYKTEAGGRWNYRDMVDKGLLQ